MAEIKSKSFEISCMNRELQKVLKSGKVLIGSNETLKALRGEWSSSKGGHLRF